MIGERCEVESRNCGCWPGERDAGWNHELLGSYPMVSGKELLFLFPPTSVRGCKKKQLRKQSRVTGGLDLRDYLMPMLGE